MPKQTIRDLDVSGKKVLVRVGPRQAVLVMSRDGSESRVIPTDADPRRWASGAVVRLGGEFRLPADAPRGRWKVSLRLADPSPRLRADGRYAIRLANEEIRFTEESGENVLAEDVEVR